LDFIERVMRVMTHINIGVALGLAAWVLQSDWQVVNGQIAPDNRAVENGALRRTVDAGLLAGDTTRLLKENP
jgi:hypothetical protein